MAKSLKIRSWLVVEPVADAEAVCSAGADTVVLDFSSPTPDAEDRVARFCREWAQRQPDRSPAALMPPFAKGGTEAAADLAVRLGIPTVILSGAGNGAEVQRLDVILRVAELRAGRLPGSTAIIALADPSGLLAADSFRHCSRRLIALGWDLDGDPLTDTARLARATIALAASAAGVAAIDPASSTTDEAAFRSECMTARENGYAGKLCRLPAQIPIINHVFGDHSPVPAGRIISNTSAPPSE